MSAGSLAQLLGRTGTWRRRKTITSKASSPEGCRPAPLSPPPAHSPDRPPEDDCTVSVLPCAWCSLTSSLKTALPSPAEGAGGLAKTPQSPFGNSGQVQSSGGAEALTCSTEPRESGRSLSPRTPAGWHTWASVILCWAVRGGVEAYPASAMLLSCTGGGLTEDVCLLACGRHTQNPVCPITEHAREGRKAPHGAPRGPRQ